MEISKIVIVVRMCVRYAKLTNLWSVTQLRIFETVSNKKCAEPSKWSHDLFTQKAKPSKWTRMECYAKQNLRNSIEEVVVRRTFEMES